MSRREVDLRWWSVHGVQCACECAALAGSGWRRKGARGLSGWCWHGAWLRRRRDGIILGCLCSARRRWLCEGCCTRDWWCCGLRSRVSWWWPGGGGGGHACIGTRSLGGIGSGSLWSDALSFAWSYRFVYVDRDRRHRWVFAGRWMYMARGLGDSVSYVSCSCQFWEEAQ